MDDTYYEDGIAGFTLGAGAALDFFRDPTLPFYNSQEGQAHAIKYNGTILECGTGFLTPGSVFIMHREARYGYKHEMKRRHADIVHYAVHNKSSSETQITRVVEMPRKMRYAVTFREVKEQVIKDRVVGKKLSSTKYAYYKR